MVTVRARDGDTSAPLSAHTRLEALARAYGDGWRVPPAVTRVERLLLWSGQGVSSVGTMASTIAFPLLVLALTRSPAQAGIVAALERVPYVLFSLVVGALVDRWDRKRVMILCDAGRALALGSIPAALWTGHLSMVQIYLASLAEGTLFVFFDLAEAACLPRVVRREQLANATAQNYATMSLAGLIGLVLGLGAGSGRNPERQRACRPARR